jgi:hypothetical protein
LLRLGKRIRRDWLEQAGSRQGSPAFQPVYARGCRGRARRQELIEAIVAALPERVVSNPGGENPAEYDRLKAAGIEPVEACTLALLRTDQF